LASDEAAVDVLFAELMQAGTSVPRLRETLARPELDEILVRSVLRRPVPVRFLELVAATPPWSERPRLLGGVALNPKTPRVLALRLLPSLFWRDLADVAASPRLPRGLRSRAEAILQEQLSDMRLGEKITLAKIATSPALVRLLGEGEPKIAQACLINPRLREEELVTAIRQDTAPRALLEAAAASSRWGDHYAVRLALVLQPRTPLGVALAQITSLLDRDLERVGAATGLRPLVQAAALRLAESERSRGRNPLRSGPQS
jgi:hypothetical protein